MATVEEGNGWAAHADIHRYRAVVATLEAKRDAYRKMADALDMALTALRAEASAKTGRNPEKLP